MSVHILARFVARPDSVEALRSLMQAMLEPTRQEPGCLRYELLHNAADPADFTFVEEWADDAAIDAHLQTPQLGALVAETRDLLAAPLDVRRYAAC